MTPQQALDLLAQSAAQFRGTRQDHQNLETAIRLLLPLVTPPAEEPKKE